MNRQGNIISFDDARRLASSNSDYSYNTYSSYTNTVPDSYEDEPTAFATDEAFADIPVFESPFLRTRSQPHSQSYPQSNSYTDSASNARYSDYSNAAFSSDASLANASVPSSAHASIRASRSASALSGSASISNSGRISRIGGEGAYGEDFTSDRFDDRHEDIGEPFSKRKQPSEQTSRRSVRSEHVKRSRSYSYTSTISGARLSGARRIRNDATSEGAPSDDSVRARAAVEVYDSEADENLDTSRAAKRDRKQKNRKKAKAEKMFNHQFGNDATPAETGSRAAVYKGQMGRNHKRAFTEMSASSRASSYMSSTADKARKSKKLKSSTASRIAVVAGCLVCVVAVVLFLYPTAKQAYLELREEDRLQAEYDALIEYNDELQDQIDYLNSDEGVEDAAREELGWVQEGENAVVVQGLSDDSEDTTADVAAQIAGDSVATPETWYSPVLDVVFGYTDATTEDDAS